MDKLLSKKNVVEVTGRPYPTIWKDIRQGKFPRPIKVGEGHFARVFWYASEIEAWMNSHLRQMYLGDPDYAETVQDQVRRAGNAKGGRVRARRRKRRRLTATGGAGR